ncbi:uncharacterized protein HaLaN_15847 [Haematococcus lacustris]|uniref:Expansin-like EG45 domain-containing protein n=1 Tax=Haematococcus lacustris TaxID=44745 RepID=A0A699Z8I4_HAELA|nr:uncharacterized protein HaLaN_15847 [Haematococcus lacustris]
MMTYFSTLLSALLLAGARFASGSAKIDWQWKSGRASWYGNGDWPIHIGGCGYDYLWKDEGTGWDVAALADVSPDYYDSCGLCYEIACDPTWTSDYYGEKFDRSRVCYDSSASVVVRIVDTCQCTYPANWWSNKRWCCGDKAHFDVSMWAFEKGALALKAWNGVFSNAVALEFWTYVGVVGWEGTNATIPDITVSIGGDQVRSIVAREGLRGLYAGYGAFLLRDLPFDAIEFVAYEQLKQGLSTYLKRELKPQETSMIGAVAGGFTGLVTTPLDVLKTRLMTQGANGRYKSLVDAVVQIARDEGTAAFLKGWQPRLIWISLGGFVFFPVLEASKKAFAPQPLTV